MIRKIGLTALAVATGLSGAVAFASPASAAKPDLGNATGNVTCQITAKVKITPPLKDSVVAPNVIPSTTVAKTKSTSCTSSGGNIGTFMNGGKSKGVVTSTGTEPGTCTGLATPGSSPFTAVIQWKPKGAKANNSNVTFQNVGGSLTGFTLPANGAAGKATSVVSGSFAGDTAYATAIAEGGIIDISRCFDVTTVKPGKNGKPDKVKTKAAKGLKKINIGGGSLVLELP